MHFPSLPIRPETLRLVIESLREAWNMPTSSDVTDAQTPITSKSKRHVRKITALPSKKINCHSNNTFNNIFLDIYIFKSLAQIILSVRIFISVVIVFHFMFWKYNFWKRYTAILRMRCILTSQIKVVMGSFMVI